MLSPVSSLSSLEAFCRAVSWPSLRPLGNPQLPAMDCMRQTLSLQKGITPALTCFYIIRVKIMGKEEQKRRKVHKSSGLELSEPVRAYQGGEVPSSVFAVVVDKNITLSNSHYEQTDQHHLLINAGHSESLPRLKQDRRSGFYFDAIFRYERKIRSFFEEHLARVVEGVYEGLNQSMLLFGREENEKSRFLFGVSRDPGLIPCILQKVFDHATKKNIEARVILKLSAFRSRRGRLEDLVLPHCEPLHLCSNEVQDDFLLGVSEVIVRNLKTALKIMRIVFDNLEAERKGEDLPCDELFFNFKIEQNASTKEGEKYVISRLRLIKLGNETVERREAETQAQSYLQFINLLSAIHTHEAKEFKKARVELPRCSPPVELVKRLILKASKLTSIVVLNKKINSLNTAYNSIVPTKYLREVRLRRCRKELDLERNYQSILRVLSVAVRMTKSVQINLRKKRTAAQVAKPIAQGTLLAKLVFQKLGDLVWGFMRQNFILESLITEYVTMLSQLYGKSINNDDPEEFYQCKRENIPPEVQQPILREAAFWAKNITLLYSKFGQVARKLDSCLQEARQARAEMPEQPTTVHEEEALLIRQSNDQLIEFASHEFSCCQQFLKVTLNLAVHWLYDKNKTYPDVPVLARELLANAHSLYEIAGLGQLHIQQAAAHFEKQFFWVEEITYQEKLPVVRQGEQPEQAESAKVIGSGDVDVIGKLQDLSILEYQGSFLDLGRLIEERRQRARVDVQALAEGRKVKEWRERRLRKKRQADFSFDSVVERMFHNDSLSQ